MEGRLRGGTVTPHPRSCSHAGGEGAARFALQIDAEAVGVLGVLEQEPGTGEGLLTGGASVAAGLIFICQRKGTEKKRPFKNELVESWNKCKPQRNN